MQRILIDLFANASSVDSYENQNCCHQMTDFKAKMHQIRFRLGLRPRARWGSLQRSPIPPSWIWGPTSKEREREERGGEGRRGKGRGGEGKGRGGSLRLCAEYIFFFG